MTSPPEPDEAVNDPTPATHEGIDGSKLEVTAGDGECVEVEA